MSIEYKYEALLDDGQRITGTLSCADLEDDHWPCEEVTEDLVQHVADRFSPHYIDGRLVRMVIEAQEVGAQ